MSNGSWFTIPSDTSSRIRTPEHPSEGASDPGPFLAGAVLGEGEGYYVANGLTFYRLVQPLLGPYDASRKTDVVGTVSVDMQISPVDARITRNLLGDIKLRVTLLSVFGLFLYGYTRRVFVRPLLKLAAAADRFGKTGFSPPVHIRTGDGPRPSRNHSTDPSKSGGEARSPEGTAHGRGRQSREERVPRQHEPRDPDADEWRSRDARARSRYRAITRSA